MFEINEDKTINITRGDIGAFTVDVLNEAGEKYLFQKGDVVRIKVTEKKACENVMFQKDFVVEEETEQVEILLTEEDTKIGEVISKPTDYWYEIELNPLTNPQTIIGYDEDGAKIFKLYPEGKDVEPIEPTPEDIPVVDEELDLTSERPVQNHVIARAILNLQEEIKKIDTDVNITSEDLEPLVVGIEENKSNIAKNKGNIEDLTSNVENLSNTLDAHTANTSNPHNVTAEQISYDNSISGMNASNVQGAIDEVSRTLGYTVTSKNYLPYPYYNTTLQSQSVKFTDNGDGTVTINGTATGDAIFQLKHREYDYLTLKTDTYTVTGVPENSNGVQIRVLNSDGEIIATDEGNGANLTINETENIGSYIFVASGTTVNNLVIEPMISKEGGEYEPYAADLHTKLKHYDYLDIKDKITVNTANCNLHGACVKNGNVYIWGYALKQSASNSYHLFTIESSKYYPPFSPIATVGTFHVASDAQKIANVTITASTGRASMWNNGAMNDAVYFYFIYPLF